MDKIYTFSLNYLNDRFFIYQIGENEKIIKLKNTEITEEILEAITDIVLDLNLSNTTIYTLSSFIKKDGTLKHKWLEKKEGKKLLKLLKKITYLF